MVNNVGMSSNPTDISNASELVIWVDILQLERRKGGIRQWYE
jgi:hypothetical protein